MARSGAANVPGSLPSGAVRKVSRLILALGAFFAVAVTLAACGSDVPGNSVAVVAGNPISADAFNHWMYVDAKGSSQGSPTPVIVPNDPPQFNKCISDARKAIPQLAKESTSQLRSQCSALFTQLSSQVLDFLIKSYWYQADAAKLHIKVSDSQVQQQFNQEKAQAYPTEAGFQSFLTQSGQTVQDILYRVRLNLIYTQLLNRATKKVSPAEISTYYFLHKSSFGTPESRNIRIVLAKTLADAQAAKAALDSGQSWNAVAKQYSTDASTKNKGGLLTGVTKGQQDVALDNAAFAAPRGKVLGPIKGGPLVSGYYVFEVTSVKSATQQSLTQATAQIQSLLSQEAQTSAQSAVDAQAKKNWLSQTSCRQYYAMADCHGYKAPSSSSTTSTSASTSS
jgi:parvulin-like peptidyl-prolyl isomerase